jgi:hypothetical protein
VVLSLLLVVAALSMSLDASFMAFQSLLAWSVWPLFQADTWAGAIGLHAVAHASVGAAVVWMLRHRLWSADWREAECALPIEPGLVKRSDLQAVAWCLMPLACLYALGVGVWVNQANAAARWEVLASGIMGLGVSLGLSLLAGWSMVRCSRVRSWTALRFNVSKQTVAGMQPMAVLPSWRALVFLPLARGPARRVGLALCWMSGSVCGAFLLSGLLDEQATLFMLLAGMVSLAVTPRLEQLICSDLLPLHEACGPLPVSSRGLARLRRMLGLLPASLGLLSWVMALSLSGHRVHLGWSAMYVLAWIASHAMLSPPEASTVLHPPGRRAVSGIVAWWLLFASVQGALAAEVLS